MASSLDSAINQHLQNLKANNPLLIAGRGPPNHVGPNAGAAPPGAPSWTLPGPGGPGPAVPPVGQPQMVSVPPQQSVATLTQPTTQPPPAGAGVGPGMLSVAIDNLNFRYSLSEVDLRETFQRWGPIQSVHVHHDGTRDVGVVHFADRIDASDAQRQLHGHVCSFENGTGTLVVVPGGPEQLNLSVPRPPYMQGNTVPQAMSAPAPLGAPGLGPGPPMPGQGPMQGGPPPNGLPPAGPHVGQPTGMPPGGPPSGGPPMTGMPQSAGPPPAGPSLGGQPLGGPPMGATPPAGPQLIGPSPAGAMPKSTPTSFAHGNGGVAGSVIPPPGKGEAKGDNKGKLKGWQPSSNSWDTGVNGRPAWSCKIIIQAESLHPEFPTVQKILGINGMNVDHIRTQTGCTVQLRGRGSGQAEPDTGQELTDQMFLWLASDNANTGKPALDMSQDLLKSVYEEHQVWCQTNHLMHPTFLEPTIIENPESASGPSVPAPPPGKGAGVLPLDRGDWGRGFHGKGPY